MKVYLLVLLCACTSEPQEHSFRTIVEDNVPVAVTEGGPKYNEPPFRFDPILRIQQDEHVPASLLTAPTDFSPGPNGTLIVVERNSGRTVIYDSEGEFIREIGGKGAGPGEFERIQNLCVQGDTLAFYDWSQMRLSMFESDGTFLDVFPTSDYGRQTGIDFLRGDLLALMDRSFRHDQQLTFQSACITIVRRATGDTLADLTTEHVLIGDVSAQQGGSVVVSAIRPLTGSPMALVTPVSHILLTTGEQPDIDLYDLAGRLVRRIRLDLPPRRVTQEMIDAYWSGEGERLAIFGRTIDPEYKAEKLFPKQAGWWNGVIADDAGYLWLKDPTSNPAQRPSWPTRFIVIDVDGRYLGNVEMPSTNGRIRNGRFYALVRSPDTDLSEPTVFRIVPAVAGVDYP